MKGQLEALLGSLEVLPDNVVVLSSVDSTQAMALRLVDQLTGEEQCLGSAVILARTQTHGVGRGERTWSSPPGGLYLTWMACHIEDSLLARLPVLAAAAALRMMEEVGVHAGVKWPNDLILDGAKVGGLLVHARRGRLHWCAVGLGVNVTVLPELPPAEAIPVTRLADHCTGPAPTEKDIPRLAGAFVTHLRRALADPVPAQALWEERLLHRAGEAISVRTGPSELVSGTFLGVTPEGYLRLDVDGAERTLASGILEA